MKDKKLVKAFVMFILAISTLATSVFAWFSVSSQTQIGQIVGETSSYKAALVFAVKKNSDLDYIEISTTNELSLVMNNIIPNDKIHFKISMSNIGTIDTTMAVKIRNLVSEIPYPGYNMLDIYYLENGLIYIKDMATLEEVPVQKIGDTLEIVKYDQVLSPYRLSYLVDAQFNLNLIDNLVFPIGKSIEITFTLVYDQNTERSEYEDGQLHLNSIYVYLN